MQTAEDKDGDSNDGHAVDATHEDACFSTGMSRWLLATVFHRPLYHGASRLCAVLGN